jgi:xanthine dehydrogenase YagS FAD-binding subunit
MSVALLALGATVNVRSVAGERKIAIADFHRLPEDHPERDTNLNQGELIVSVDLPRPQFAQKYHYLKVRERASYAFALVAVAAGLDLDEGGRVREARIALGGVAHKPWRVERAEDAAALLAGKTIQDADLEAVAAAAVSGAQPLSQNAYKIPLARNAVVRAVKLAMEA